MINKLTTIKFIKSKRRKRFTSTTIEEVIFYFSLKYKISESGISHSLYLYIYNLYQYKNKSVGWINKWASYQTQDTKKGSKSLCLLANIWCYFWRFKLLVQWWYLAWRNLFLQTYIYIYILMSFGDWWKS